MQTVAVPACSCAMAWMRARSSRSSSSKALFLRHPKNPAQTLGISGTGGCPPRCYGTASRTRLALGFLPTPQPRDPSSPRPLVMGMTSLAEGELQ